MIWLKMAAPKWIWITILVSLSLGMGSAANRIGKSMYTEANEPDTERFEGYEPDPDRKRSRGDEPDNKHDFDADSKLYDLGLEGGCNPLDGDFPPPYSYPRSPTPTLDCGISKPQSVKFDEDGGGCGGVTGIVITKLTNAIQQLTSAVESIAISSVSQSFRKRGWLDSDDDMP